MTKYRFSVFFLSGFFLVAGFGCATSPIAKQYREQAMMEETTFPMVLQNPDAYFGDIVLWGGSIIKTTNLKDGTEIVVLDEPLGDRERPEGSKHSRGRFIAKSSRFLDPEVYKKGRKITLAGEVIGKQSRPLGETTYTYPLVAIRQLYVWEKKPQYIYYYPYYPYPDYWDWGWGPYWGGSPWWWGY